jgi:hypothetical protein
MKNLFPLLLAVIVTGCSSTKQYPVRLESDPPGARVFLSLGANAKQAAKNRSYLGQTPCTVEITGDRKGFFKLPEIAFMSSYVAGAAIFTAEPPSGASNQFTQTITYRGKSEYVTGDKIPQAVFFDMSKNQ